MADITKCKGTNCPVKKNCYRFTAESDEYAQAYFVDQPGEYNENNEFKCSYYWGPNGEAIWGKEEE